MSTLRNSLIRLAHQKPELRAHLLPLLRQGGCEKLPEGGMRDNCEKKVEEGKDKKASLTRTAKITQKDLEKVNKMTDDNQHTMALATLAGLLEMDKIQKVLVLVEKIWDIMNFMPPDLLQFRTALSKQVYAVAKRTVVDGDDSGKTVYDYLA